LTVAALMALLYAYLKNKNSNNALPSTAAVASTTGGIPQESKGFLGNTTAYLGSNTYALKKNATFTQQFVAHSTGKPTELGIRMGNNQNIFSARITVSKGSSVLLDKNYDNLVQRSMDWSTVFDLTSITESVNIGDQLSFSVTPNHDIGFAPANKPQIDYYTAGALESYGNIISVFYMKCPGGADDATTADTNPIDTPGMLGDTYIYDKGVTYALFGGSTFTQKFVAHTTGKPTQLCILMGNNQIPWNATLTIVSAGKTILNTSYTGLKQRYSDWATVFDLSACTSTVNLGDIMTFSITPNQQVGVAPAKLYDSPEYSLGNLQGYGGIIMRFQMKST